MSLKTKLLELFKYEPETDGAQKFNIESALNDNWDKIEAWAQSVKTALAGLVPTSRKVNGKALTEDVTLTAADIKMPDSEEDVWAAMAKRAVWDAVLVSQQSALAWAVAQKEPKQCGFDPYTTDTPYEGYWCAELTLHAPSNQWRVLYVTNVVTLERWFNIYNIDRWLGWRQVSLAVAPEVHELPLASGFPTQSYANTYYKTQEGIVHLNFCITRGSSTAFTASEVVCTLPVGYRPSSVRMFSVGGDSGYFGTVAAPVQVYVTSDGELKFISCAQKVTWIYGEITYLAG